MKVHFLVTLNISGISRELLTEDDLESYRAVLENAVRLQNDFAGLTPDYLSESGVGVDSFTVDHDTHQQELTDGDAVAFVWGKADVQAVAEDYNITLAHDQMTRILEKFEHDHDANLGANWDNLVQAMLYIVRKNAGR